MQSRCCLEQAARAQGLVHRRTCVPLPEPGPPSTNTTWCLTFAPPLVVTLTPSETNDSVVGAEAEAAEVAKVTPAPAAARPKDRRPHQEGAGEEGPADCAGVACGRVHQPRWVSGRALNRQVCACYCVETYQANSMGALRQQPKCSPSQSTCVRALAHRSGDTQQRKRCPGSLHDCCPLPAIKEDRFAGAPGWYGNIRTWSHTQVRRLKTWRRLPSIPSISYAVSSVLISRHAVGCPCTPWPASTGLPAWKRLCPAQWFIAVPE